MKQKAIEFFQQLKDKGKIYVLYQDAIDTLNCGTDILIELQDDGVIKLNKDIKDVIEIL